MFEHKIEIDKTKLLPSRNTLKELGFEIYDVIDYIEEYNMNMKLSFEDFIKYCKRNDITDLFIVEDDLHIVSYYIPEAKSILKGIESYDKQIENFVDYWNMKIEEFENEDVTGCGKLILYAEGRTYSLMTELEYNPIEDYIRENAEDIEEDTHIGISGLLNWYIAQLEDAYEEELQDKNKARLREIYELKKYILGCTSFLAASNKDKRIEFARTLINSKPYVETYHSALYSDFYGDMYLVKITIENLYSLYKIVVKEEGKHMGEKLSPAGIEKVARLDHTYENNKR